MQKYKKEIIINNNKYTSISNVYKKNKYDTLSRKIKIIFAESLPYTKPEEFNPENDYKIYMCINFTNNLNILNLLKFQFLLIYQVL